MCQAFNVAVIESMSRIYPDAKLVGQLGGVSNGFELRIGFFGARGIRLTAGMQFNKISRNFVRRSDLIEIGLDEDADRNPRVM